jgi:hypothetical protein
LKDERPCAKSRNTILAAARQLGKKLWNSFKGNYGRSLLEILMRLL